MGARPRSQPHSHRIADGSVGVLAAGGVVTCGSRAGAGRGSSRRLAFGDGGGDSGARRYRRRSSRLFPGDRMLEVAAFRGPAAGGPGAVPVAYLDQVAEPVAGIVSGCLVPVIAVGDRDRFQVTVRSGPRAVGRSRQVPYPSFVIWRGRQVVASVEVFLSSGFPGGVRVSLSSHEVAASPGTSWCLTVTDQHGHPAAHGCAKPERRRKARRKKDLDAPPPGDRARSPGGYGTWPAAPGRPGPGPNRRPGIDLGHRLRSPARNSRSRSQRPAPPPDPDTRRGLHLAPLPPGRGTLRLRACDPLGRGRENLRL